VSRKTGELSTGLRMRWVRLQGAKAPGGGWNAAAQLADAEGVGVGIVCRK
jgi:hypothetical protein